MGRSMRDLPHDLVGEKILSRVPLTSLREVRSTCKTWNALTKDWILGKAAARQQFLGFMMKDLKVCSVRFSVRNKELDGYIMPVDLLDNVQISEVFHCDGLLLCVVTDLSRLVVWNPYLGQTRSVGPRTSFHRRDKYALGYDINRNHKILRFIEDFRVLEFEIFDFSSGSWRVLEPPPECHIKFHQSRVSLKGVAYFYFNVLVQPDSSSSVRHRYPVCRQSSQKFEEFLLCFDFTTERFGPHLPLPFKSSNARDDVILSCVREEQLAVLSVQRPWDSSHTVEIWVTTKIAPTYVSWSKFLKVDINPCSFNSFFIDEEEKLVVIFSRDANQNVPIPCYNKAFILGEAGFCRSARLGEALSVRSGIFGHMCPFYISPFVCSSAYFPSLVQVSQPEPAVCSADTQEQQEGLTKHTQDLCFATQLPPHSNDKGTGCLNDNNIKQRMILEIKTTNRFLLLELMNE